MHYHLKKFCCGCFTGEKKLTNAKDIKPPISYYFNKFILKISRTDTEEDNYLQNICQTCYAKLEEIGSFWMQCLIRNKSPERKCRCCKYDPGTLQLMKTLHPDVYSFFKNLETDNLRWHSNIADSYVCNECVRKLEEYQEFYTRCKYINGVLKDYLQQVKFYPMSRCRGLSVNLNAAPSSIVERPPEVENYFETVYVPEDKTQSENFVEKEDDVCVFEGPSTTFENLDIKPVKYQTGDKIVCLNGTNYFYVIDTNKILDVVNSKNSLT